MEFYFPSSSASWSAARHCGGLCSRRGSILKFCDDKRCSSDLILPACGSLSSDVEKKILQAGQGAGHGRLTRWA